MYIVTGGGGGIGRALAQALAHHNHHVFIVGRREPCLIETASYSELISYQCVDISSSNGRQQLVAALKNTPKIDGLIHNAGIIEPIVSVDSIEEASWKHVMATNLEAPLFLNQLLQDKLVNGRVLHMGSGAAHFPVAGWSAYCVSKAALCMLTQCWQLECKDTAFASVMPGIIDTDMQAHIRDAACMESDKLDFFKRLKQEHKLLSPETVAAFLCWLLLQVDTERFVSKEWDIYDETHHHEWLKYPHCVPSLPKE